MNVNEVRLFTVQQFSETFVRIDGPHGFRYQGELLDSNKTIDFAVASLVEDNLVSGALQQFVLLPDDHVFAARKLILIMDKDNFHGCLPENLSRPTRALLL